MLSKDQALPAPVFRANCQPPLVGERVNPESAVPSWESTTPPSAVGLTQAETVKLPVRVTAPVPLHVPAVPVHRCPLAPSSLMSGSNWSPVFQVAPLVLVRPSGVAGVLSMAAGWLLLSLVLSLSAQVWVAVVSCWEVSSVTVGVGVARPLTVYGVTAPVVVTAHRSGILSCG